MNIPIGENVFRPRKSLSIFIASTLLFLSVLFKLNLEKEWLTLLLTTSIIFFCIGLFEFVVNSKIRLMINDEGITYKTILIRRFANWSEIESISHHFVWQGKSMHLEFAVKTSNPKKSFQFITHYYSRNSLQQICSLLHNKIPNKVNDKIQQMSEGKFSWYVF